jgi:hypothetical protein
LRIYTKVLCILLVATFLCLSRVQPASSINPFLPNNPLCASKTLPNQAPFNTWITPLNAPNSLAGWGYIPVIAPVFLRIEELYDDRDLAGDIAGGGIGFPSYVPGGIDYPGSAPFKITYPSGGVDILDIATMAKAFASVEPLPPWNYMNDVYPDKKINIQDIATAAKFAFSHHGPYFWPYLGPTTWDPAYSVTVQFFPSTTVIPADPLGVVGPIPPGDTSFVVTILGGPVVGTPAPVVFGGPIGAVVTWWNVYP